MIGRAIDTVVSWFDPAGAARRMHARSVYENVAKRSYDAAVKDRRTNNWRTSNQSADLELFSDADVMRSRARDLVRNNAYANGALRAIVRNVVGCGIQPQALVKFSAPRNPDKEQPKDNTRFNDAAEALFWKWQQRVDVAGRVSFYELQSLALHEVAEAGECLVRFVESNDRSRPLSLALELIEADRIASDVQTVGIRNRNPQNNNEIRRGVEVDAAGRAVAYWIYPRNPNDINSLWTKPERFPADEFLHLYRVERIGQTRGLTWFAPVIRWLRDLHEYMDNELVASKVSSCFTVAIKTVGGPADGEIVPPSGSDSSDVDGNKFEHLQAGMVARLFPDEDVAVIDPSRGQSEAEAYINLILRSIAVGMGLSYERLTRDYSRTTYSSNRAGDLEDRREFRPLQDWLIQTLCIPVWLRFVEAAVLADADGFPTADQFLGRYDLWTDHEWQRPGWEWVDPEAEQAASEAGIKSNQTTLAEEIGKRGGNWKDTLRQRAIEEKFRKSLGLEDEEEAAAAAEDPEDDEDDEDLDTRSERKEQRGLIRRERRRISRETKAVNA